MVMVGSSTARAMAMARIALLPRTLEPCPSLHRLLLPLPHPRLTLIRFVSASSSSFVLASTATDHSASLLDKLRIRQLRDRRAKSHTPKQPPPHKTANSRKVGSPPLPAHEPPALASSFKELSLSDELVAAVEELNLTQPTEVQCLAIPAVLDGQSVAIASHTGSGKTLAYMIPLVQRLRQEEMEQGKATRSRRPRAVVLCPTRELTEQVFRVAKSICHHARFRAAMIGGGVRMRPQEDALNSPIDMLVGTPGRVLKHVEEGNMAYGDIKYVVLDEADTMFDRGFGPDVRKFLMPVRNRSCKPEDPGFQTILVTATITKAVQKLLNDEFPGIRHIHTSTLHKKISTARHGFIKLSGTENKLESLLQVLEPSLSKGDRVMVFCNTLNSCRAVDHFLTENGIKTVNYHGAVPAEERVEVLNQFRNEDDKCPALVCTDLAARGLDLVVDHVIMFDFPLNSIDYLHRTGRTARMGAKGKITSLVTKRSLVLAELIEEAIQKGETLEGLSLSKVKMETSRTEAVKFKQNKGTTVKSATRATKSSTKKPKAVFSSAKKSPAVRLAKGPMGGKSGAKRVTKTASKKVVKLPIKR